MDWNTFKTGVKEAYTVGGNATQGTGYAAVAAYVKSLICREVDSDLLLSKSYWNRWLELKAQVAGSQIAVFATTKPEVQTRITVDASRAAISSFIDKAIQEGIDELNAMVTVFDKYLVEWALDMQRHVVCFTQNQETTYLKAAVTNEGFISKITPTANSRITKVTYERYAPALAAQAYAVDDYVMSNKRIYLCVTAGTVATVGTGLQSVDGEEETLGTAGFEFAYTLESKDCTPIEWEERDELLNKTIAGDGPFYTLNPWTTELWVYPRLDSTDFRIRVNWNGVKQTFSGSDTVTFDETCFVCASEYVRGMIQKNVALDPRQAAAALSTYQSMLRRLWTDCQERSNSR